jgi:tetratricopeptide (TPR) repeat protein
VASSPRIDELRKRLEKDPGSRLFAQLAEELRKAGDLREAIDLCRDGLQRHPAYPSARMTLGRALFDSRDLQGARAEFEAVLKGAPDNILASRLLGECLDGLGDAPGALARYRATLALAPGDRAVQARIEAAEARLAGPAGPAAPPEPPRVAEVEEAVTPIPLVAADEPFELERTYEAPPTAAAGVAPTPPESSFDATLPAGGAVGAPSPTVEEMFDFDAPAEAPREAAPVFAVDAAMLSDRLPPVEAPPPRAEPPRMLIPAEGEPPPPWVESPAGSGREAVAETPPPPPAADLVSPTLAELYLNQGFPARAAEVLRMVVAREPGNERARARLAEIERLGGPAGGPPTPSAADAAPEHVREARRWVIQRTIARLEEMRAALRRE